MSIDFKSIVRDHVPHRWADDSWYCRPCDKWLRAREVDGHLIEKLQEAEQKQLDALVMYRGMWLSVSRYIKEWDDGHWSDPETPLMLIAEALEKMEMPK